MERPRRNGRRSTLIGPAAVVGLIALAGAAATAFWPPPPDERGWPALFGPDEDSSSRAWIDLGRIAERGPVEKWRRAIGTGYSSPVTADGRLIVQQRVPAVDRSSDGSADLAQVTEAGVDARERSGAGPFEAEPLDTAVSHDDEVIACYDLETGEPLWEHRYPTTYECQFEYTNGPYGTPRIDGGRVYTLGAQWQARCLDLATGSVVWRRDLAADYDVEEGLFGFGPGILIDGGRMIFNLGAADAGVIALDAATGGTLWTSGRDRAGYTMPRVATVHGKRYAFVLTFEGLQALDPATGEQRFFVPFTNKVPMSVAATSPLVWDDRVLLVTGPGPGALCLRVEPDGGYEEVWRDRRAIDSQWNTLVRVDDVLYGFTSKRLDTAFRAVDLADGAVRWSWPSAIERGTALRTRNALILWGEHGHLAFLDIDANRQRLRWISKRPLLDTPTYASPAFDDGLLVLRNEGRLVCLSVRPEDLAN